MSYSVLGGNSLAEVLGLRHDNAPGIATRQNPDGTWELTGWPAALGAQPTQADVNTWASEVPARRAAEKRARVKGALRENDPETVKLRAVLRVLMASLVEARQTVNALRAAVVNATSLADLKTRATGVTALANRDWAQAIDAVDAVVDSGQAEE